MDNSDTMTQTYWFFFFQYWASLLINKFLSSEFWVLSFVSVFSLMVYRLPNHVCFFVGRFTLYLTMNSSICLGELLSTWSQEHVNCLLKHGIRIMITHWYIKEAIQTLSFLNSIPSPYGFINHCLPHYSNTYVGSSTVNYVCLYKILFL